MKEFMWIILLIKGIFKIIIGVFCSLLSLFNFLKTSNNRFNQKTQGLVLPSVSPIENLQEKQSLNFRKVFFGMTKRQVRQTEEDKPESHEFPEGGGSLVYGWIEFHGVPSNLVYCFNSSGKLCSIHVAFKKEHRKQVNNFQTMNSAFNYILQDLTNKYGEPLTKRNLENSSTTYEWSNPRTSIFLNMENISDDAIEFSLTYDSWQFERTLKALAKCHKRTWLPAGFDE